QDLRKLAQVRGLGSVTITIAHSELGETQDRNIDRFRFLELDSLNAPDRAIGMLRWLFDPRQMNLTKRGIDDVLDPGPVEVLFFDPIKNADLDGVGNLPARRQNVGVR